MKQDKRRGLTRIVLALALVDYCMTPVVLAEDSAWVDSGETNIFQRAVPWLYSEKGGATTGADHVTLTSDLKGTRPQDSETDKHLCLGDKLTVSWEIGDTEDDVDPGGLGDNAKTIDIIHWMSCRDAQGGDPKEPATRVTSYTLTDADRGCYIGTEITSTTQTGTPNVGAVLHLYGISTASSGENDGDNITPGSVVNQNLRVATFVDSISINLVNDSISIRLGKTRMAKLCSDENKNGRFGAGVDANATANYDFRRILSGGSQQFDISDDIVNSSFDSNNLVVPATNDETRTNLNDPACDGKEALSIPTNGDGAQGYKFHTIYRHK